jgi:hypothetical protein
MLELTPALLNVSESEPSISAATTLRFTTVGFCLLETTNESLKSITV